MLAMFERTNKQNEMLQETIIYHKDVQKVMNA